MSSPVLRASSMDDVIDVSSRAVPYSAVAARSPQSPAHARAADAPHFPGDAQLTASGTWLRGARGRPWALIAGVAGAMVVSAAAAAFLAWRGSAPAPDAGMAQTRTSSVLSRPTEAAALHEGAATATALPAGRSTPDAAPAGGAHADAAAVPAPAPAPSAIARCTHCGVVESVQAVVRNGPASGAGAVAGGVLGGVLGHQVGGGNGRTAMTVLGAIGGGLAGQAAEKRVRAVTVYRVRVRMDDGSVRTLERPQAVAEGAAVRIDGQKLVPISR